MSDMTIGAAPSQPIQAPPPPAPEPVPEAAPSPESSPAPVLDSAPSSGGAPATIGLDDTQPVFGDVPLDRPQEAVPLGTSTQGEPPVASLPPEPPPAAPPPPPTAPPPPPPEPVPPPTTPPPITPPRPPKVFIVGNRRKFGGKYIRKGLQAMLDAYDGKKAKGKTHSKLSPEDAEKLRAILGSKDPAVLAMLDTKVPRHKSFMIDETGKIIGTLDTVKQVMAEKSLAMEKHDKGWERSAGGQISVASSTYQVAGTELHSPIKIALDGGDATLNSGNGFHIDLDGFGQGKGAVKTSGGLNTNEAWLVRDKDGDGVVRKGVVDGRDVYGDHEGRFGNGYEELAKDFAGEVKVDPATGKRYLDLTDPASRAGRELKLLDARGNLVPAGQVLRRIDVDFAEVAESDATGANQIRQRAAVTYKDGHTASSADQWYSTR